MHLPKLMERVACHAAILLRKSTTSGERALEWINYKMFGHPRSCLFEHMDHARPRYNRERPEKVVPFKAGVVLLWSRLLLFWGPPPHGEELTEAEGQKSAVELDLATWAMAALAVDLAESSKDHTFAALKTAVQTIAAAIRRIPTWSDHKT